MFTKLIMNNTQDKQNYIVRSWGCAYPIFELANHFGIFKKAIDAENTETYLIDLASQFNYMEYEKKYKTIHIKGYLPGRPPYGYGHSTFRSKGELTERGISTILDYVQNHSQNILYKDADVMKSIPKILKDWKASDKLFNCFHTIFPYNGIFSYCDPEKIEMVINGKNYSHWKLLQKSRIKEGKKCHICYKMVPWLIKPDTKSICSCDMYYNDFLERTPNNPYFDDDNWAQREHDREDAFRRQD